MKLSDAFYRSAFLALALFAVNHCVHAGKIIYPWRVTTAIAIPGETFEVWFDTYERQSETSVELNGPYSTITAVVSLVSGNRVYDQWSSNSYNQVFAVKVPSGAPADRYDLVLNSTTGDGVLLGAVSMIAEYRTDFLRFSYADLLRWHGAASAVLSALSVSAAPDDSVVLRFWANLIKAE